MRDYRPRLRLRKRSDHRELLLFTNGMFGTREYLALLTLLMITWLRYRRAELSHNSKWWRLNKQDALLGAFTATPVCVMIISKYPLYGGEIIYSAVVAYSVLMLACKVEAVRARKQSLALRRMLRALGSVGLTFTAMQITLGLLLGSALALGLNATIVMKPVPLGMIVQSYVILLPWVGPFALLVILSIITLKHWQRVAHRKFICGITDLWALVIALVPAMALTVRVGENAEFVPILFAAQLIGAVCGKLACDSLKCSQSPSRMRSFVFIVLGGVFGLSGAIMPIFTIVA